MHSLRHDLQTFDKLAHGVKGLKAASLTLIAAISLSPAVCHQAKAAEIDISSQVNANLSGYYNGSVYPSNGGPISIGGIGFNLASFPGGGTGIVQANGGNSSYEFAIGQANVTTVYTVINSAYGQYGVDIGALTFLGSSGASYTYTLTEGDNVRDHATTSYNVIAPNVYATANFGGGDRLDVQQIVLPQAFASQTLESVTLTATGSGGDPFIAAITTSTGVSAVPLPPSAPLFAAALLVLGTAGYGMKRNKKAGTVA